VSPVISDFSDRPVAQRSEQETHNFLVASSILAGPIGCVEKDSKYNFKKNMPIDEATLQMANEMAQRAGVETYDQYGLEPGDVELWETYRRVAARLAEMIGQAAEGAWLCMALSHGHQKDRNVSRLLDCLGDFRYRQGQIWDILQTAGIISDAADPLKNENTRLKAELSGLVCAILKRGGKDVTDMTALDRLAQLHANEQPRIYRAEEIKKEP